MINFSFRFWMGWGHTYVRIPFTLENAYDDESRVLAKRGQANARLHDVVALPTFLPMAMTADEFAWVAFDQSLQEHAY